VKIGILSDDTQLETQIQTGSSFQSSLQLFARILVVWNIPFCHNHNFDSNSEGVYSEVLMWLDYYYMTTSYSNTKKQFTVLCTLLQQYSWFFKTSVLLEKQIKKNMKNIFNVHTFKMKVP